MCDLPMLAYKITLWLDLCIFTSAVLAPTAKPTVAMMTRAELSLALGGLLLATLRRAT